MAIRFPRRLLREADHDWNIIGNTMGSGQTNSASVAVRSDGGGMWTSSLNNIRLRDADDTLLWRAVRQVCNGGVVPLVVPRNDTVFAPFPGVETEGPITPHSDDSYFSDDAGYYQPIIDIECGAAALRATSLAITINNAEALRGGEAFSIWHPTFDWRLYEIATVVMADDTTGVITFNPPLREAVLAGTRLEFDRPRCLMKLVNAAAMNLNTTTYPFPLTTVKFIEAKYAA